MRRIKIRMPQEAVRQYIDIHLDKTRLGGLYICLVKLFHPGVTLQHSYAADYFSKGLETTGLFLELT